MKIGDIIVAENYTKEGEKEERLRQQKGGG